MNVVTSMNLIGILTDEDVVIIVTVASTEGILSVVTVVRLLKKASSRKALIFAKKDAPSTL